MANKEIRNLNEASEVISSDVFIVQKADDGQTEKVQAQNMLPNDIVTAAKISEQEAWTNFTYTGTWVAYDATTYFGGAYMKDHMGFVHLRGLVKSGTDGTSITTLPEGYRPEYRMIFPVMSNDIAGRLDILPTGTVVPQASTTSPTWVSLNGIIFKAA